MRLAELQRAVQAHLLAGGPAPPDLVAAVRPPAQERWRIYSDGYRIRLIEALAKGFPAIAARLGPSTFGALLLDFVANVPSVHRSIRDYGGELEAWLRREAAEAAGAELAMLADLAAFEWALSAAFDAADAAAVTHAELAAVEPKRWAGLRFRAAPCVRTVVLTSNAVDVRRAVLAAVGADAAAPEGVPGPRAERATARTWLVWRHALGTRFRALDDAETLALRWCVAGMPFGELCAALEAACGDSAPLRAATWLRTWTADGVLVAA